MVSLSSYKRAPILRPVRRWRESTGSGTPAKALIQGRLVASCKRNRIT